MEGTQATYRDNLNSRREFGGRCPPYAAAAGAVALAPREASDTGSGAMGLAMRCASAARRRAAYVWRRLTVGRMQPAVPAALAWLAHHGRQRGLSPATGDNHPCPGLTGAGLETLAGYGQIDLARAWTAWLLSVQLADGAFPDAGLRHASLINTARVLRGFVVGSDEFPECHAAARRAADYLAKCIDAKGRLAPVDLAGSSFELWAPPSLFLACLPPLKSAARRWGVADWSDAADRAEARLFRRMDLTTWTGPGPAFAGVVEALLDLGHDNHARQALRGPAALQRRDGSVPAGPAAEWTASAGLARWATVWYTLGERGRADRALACLRRRQLSSGALVGSWGRGACDHPRRESAWAVRNFLDAARLQVETAFETSEQILPDSIAPSDGRMQAARRWLAGLRPDAVVADVGCGSGRFLRQLAAEFPLLRFIGIDPSRRLLAELPAYVEPRQGGLLRIPAADGEFDGVLAVESLEHALLPDHAVREICRVVRPGGSVLIIDKHRARQALSRHEPWEQWFEPEQVAAWLSAGCGHVRVEPVSHGSRPPSRPLFVAWSGTARREHSVRKLAA